MKLASTTVAVTGGGGGLGSAIRRAARARGAAELIVIDLAGAAAEAVAAEAGGHAFAADVGDEAQLNAAVTAAAEQVGPIDVFVSNAGVGGAADPVAGDEAWGAAGRST